MKIRPLHDFVLVKRVKDTESKVGAIFIPDSAREQPHEAEIVAVGAGLQLKDGRRVALDVKAGDKILFGKYAGSDITIDGETFLILRESEIFAVLS